MFGILKVQIQIMLTIILEDLNNELDCGEWNFSNVLGGDNDL
jgi:hypothetical protein